MTERANARLLRLTALLQFEQRLRQASQEELPFLLVNESAALLAFRQAALWRASASGAGGEVVAVSGVATVKQGSPYLVWMARLMRCLAARASDRAEIVTRQAMEAESPDVAGEWGEWLPGNALWLPLVGRGGRLLGGLVLARDDAWKDADLALAPFFASACAHAWEAVDPPPRGWRRLRRGRLLAAAVAVLIGLALLPVRTSVLAPAEVVARAPTMIRATIDGLVDSMHVQPNDEVRQGAKLVSLDSTPLRTRLQMAVKARDVARAEYESAVQQAFGDQRTKARLALLEGRVEQQDAEVAYVQTLLDRVEIVAPHDGIAVFDDANEWIGRPVAIGERILMLADPGDVELEIHLPVSDNMTLAPGAEIAFFPHATPHRPVGGSVRLVPYRSGLTADGTPAYRLKATLASGGEAAPRIGAKGTAKLYGPRAPLVVWALRRPMISLRQWLAL